MKFIDICKRLFQFTPEPTFTRVKTVSSLSELPEKLHDAIYVVSNNGNNKWVVFDCPDHCGRRVEVNLMKSQYPVWRLTRKKNRITLYPSVIVKGCGAHFWVVGSNIEWTLDD